MLTMDYAPGSPNWIDLGSPDPALAAAFYGALLGWEMESTGAAQGEYGKLMLGGRTVAGVGPLIDEDAPSSWTVYFHTADASATAKAVRTAGGTVRVAPMDILSAGRTAGFTDPQGAPFAVWQPRERVGLELVAVPGSLCWTELHTPDPAAARDFYHDVFGWTARPIPFAGTTCTMLAAPETGPEAAVGGIVPLFPEQVTAGLTPHWLPYFEVPDCDAAAELAVELGGRILRAPSTDRAVGRSAQLADPSGAIFAVITSLPNAA
jgi:uncharacterized protein